MTKATEFRGPLRRKILEYMDFRRALGFAMRNTAYIYAEFDNYLAANFPNVKLVNRPMVVGYLATTCHLHSTSRGYRLTLIRGLCRYLYQQNPKNYVPEPRLISYGKQKLIPHIFSDTEIKKIVRSLESGPKKKIAPLTNSTVVALIAVTGLRIGEVCRLNLEDVDIKNGIIQIQRSKFFKSRLVPITRSTAEALLLYKQTRIGYYRTTDPMAPFFVGTVGRRIHTGEIQRKFRQAVTALKIINSQGNRPRIHDLRHSFATRSLERAYQNGRDPRAILPALATYLGHVNLDNTQKYLHPSMGLLQNAATRFSRFSQSTIIEGNPT